MKTGLGVLVAATCFVAGWAGAQESPPAAQELGRLTVTDTADEGYAAGSAATASKTDTPLIELPASVQVVTQQMLRDQQARTFDQALLNVAGVRSSSTGWSENIYLRGFVTSTYFRDGFRVDDPNWLGGVVSLSNVESIEVLKGPGSILYGRMEPGGVVNIVTRQPTADRRYSLEQTAGRWGEYTTTLDASGPLDAAGRFTYSLDASYHQNQLYIDNISDRRDFVAPVLRWQPDGSTQVTLEGSWSRNRTVLYQQSLVPFDTTTLTYQWGPRNANPAPYDYSPDTTFAGLAVEHRFAGDWTLRARLSRNATALDNPVTWGQSWGPMYLQDGQWITELNTAKLKGWTDSRGSILDLEGHFATGAARHTLLVGGDYYDAAAYYDSRYSNPLGPFVPVPLFSSVVPPVDSLPVDPQAYYYSQGTSRSWGAYLQDQVALPHGLHVLAGLRYQHVHTTGLASQGVDLFGDGTLAAVEPATEHAVTPRAGLLWMPREGLSVYASYTENFGASNASTHDWRGRPLEPEGAKQQEIGAKSESADGRWSATLAIYRLTKDHVTGPDLAHPDGMGGYFQATVGSVRSQGAELTLQGRVYGGLEALLAYSYDWAYYNAGSGVYPTGTRVPHVPANMLRAYATWEFQRPSLHGLKVGGGFDWQGAAPGMYVDPDTFATDTHTIITPGHVVFDAMASWRHDLGHWKLTTQLNVRNLLDKQYYTDAFMYLAPWGYVTYGPPRSLLLSLRVER